MTHRDDAGHTAGRVAVNRLDSRLAGKPHGREKVLRRDGSVEHREARLCFMDFSARRFDMLESDKLVVRAVRVQEIEFDSICTVSIDRWSGK